MLHADAPSHGLGSNQILISMDYYYSPKLEVIVPFLFSCLLPVASECDSHLPLHMLFEVGKVKDPEFTIEMVLT
jgi:hypothetical protein